MKSLFVAEDNLIQFSFSPISSSAISFQTETVSDVVTPTKCISTRYLATIKTNTWPCSEHITHVRTADNDVFSSKHACQIILCGFGYWIFKDVLCFTTELVIFHSMTGFNSSSQLIQNSLDGGLNAKLCNWFLSS